MNYLFSNQSILVPCSLFAQYRSFCTTSSTSSNSPRNAGGQDLVISGGMTTPIAAAGPALRWLSRLIAINILNRHASPKNTRLRVTFILICLADDRVRTYESWWGWLRSIGSCAHAQAGSPAAATSPHQHDLVPSRTTKLPSSFPKKTGNGSPGLTPWNFKRSTLFQQCLHTIFFYLFKDSLHRFANFTMVEGCAVVFLWITPLIDLQCMRVWY